MLHDHERKYWDEFGENGFKRLEIKKMKNVLRKLEEILKGIDEKDIEISKIID